MGCNPILECHCRVVAALTLMLGVNGHLNSFTLSKNRDISVFFMQSMAKKRVILGQKQNT